MARVQNPTLFSAYFGVPSGALAAAGLIDPFLDVDVPLFIDPVLLEKSSNKTINTSAIGRFRKHFEILESFRFRLKHSLRCADSWRIPVV
jgi:hypothetical protein